MWVLAVQRKALLVLTLLSGGWRSLGSQQLSAHYAKEETMRLLEPLRGSQLVYLTQEKA